MTTNDQATSATKRCSRCLDRKLLTAFALDAEKHDGRQSYCRACQKLTRTYRAAQCAPRPTRKPTRYCPVCCGLSHRRAPICKGCGLPHAPEPPVLIETYGASALADADLY